jgi:gliding motility-associated lipoprotein GldD
MRKIISAIAFFSLIVSCRPEQYYPKPSGYFRIDTPAAHEYQLFDRPGFPYTFEYPTYSNIVNDTLFSRDENNKYWINIDVPSLGGMINITYKEITKDQPLVKLVDDSWGLSYFHHQKADYIDQKAITNRNGIECMIFTIGGNAATRHQFAATDSTANFMRGALYFHVTPNADSLKPATDFLLQDIQHLLLTLKWKNPVVYLYGSK